MRLQFRFDVALLCYFLVPELRHDVNCNACSTWNGIQLALAMRSWTRGPHCGQLAEHVLRRCVDARNSGLQQVEALTHLRHDHLATCSCIRTSSATMSMSASGSRSATLDPSVAARAAPGALAFRRNAMGGACGRPSLARRTAGVNDCGCWTALQLMSFCLTQTTANRRHVVAKILF